MLLDPASTPRPILAHAEQEEGQALLDAGLDLLEAGTAALEGETDPRCLMLGFQCVRALVQLYEGSGKTGKKVHIPAAVQSRPSSHASDVSFSGACMLGLTCVLQSFV